MMMFEKEFSHSFGLVAQLLTVYKTLPNIHILRHCSKESRK